MKSIRILGVLLALSTFVTSARAVLVDSMSDITYWVGTGSNQAALVIDWVDDETVTSYAWGYRWNGTATGEDMIRAIAGAIGTNTTSAVADGTGDPSLTLYTQFFTGFGNVVFQLDYLSHAEGGFEPDSNGYWAYFTANGSSTLPSSWDFSEVGMGDRTLANNSWDAWCWAPDFNGSAPTQPIAAVPEPAILALFATGAIVIIFRSRRRDA